MTRASARWAAGSGSGSEGDGPSGVEDPAGLGSDRDGESDVWSDDRAARAVWSRLAEPGDLAARELVAVEGAAGALARVRAGAGEPRWQARLSDVDTTRDRATLHRLGGRLVIPDDPEWPAGFAGLELEAPFCLWVRGPLSLRAATARSASIVGARACTPYGERVATELADGCANRGITVVSGAAYVLYPISCC